MKIRTATFVLDPGTPDARPVRRDRVTVNGERVELCRPDGGDPEITVADAPYSVAGARRLRDALDEMIGLAG